METWVTPENITNWNFASDDWCCPSAEIDLIVGRKFSYRMEAKDGTMGFDFTGELTDGKPEKAINFKFEGGRMINVIFAEIPEVTKVVESFEVDNEHDHEHQRHGWLSILQNFKNCAEENGNAINTRPVSD